MYRYLLLIIIILFIAGILLWLYKPRIKSPKAMLYTFIVGLFAMLLFNTYLTSLPIVMYNTSSITGIYLSSFPIEDIGYLIVIAILAPPLFEYFSNEKPRKK